MKYDLIVIGGGPGGYTAAIRAAQLGMRVMLAESRELGGTCLNRGCIPTKALIYAADKYRETKSFGSIGLAAEKVSFDFAKIHERKNTVVSSSRSGIEMLLKSNGIDFINAKATVLGSGKVSAGNEIFETGKILIATGSRAARIPIPGADGKNVYTSDDLLTGDGKFFDSLVIIGGGVIGVEMACIYSALGCEVTIIEAMPRVLPMMDKDISTNISMILKKSGVKIFTNASVKQIEDTAGKSLCTFIQKEYEQKIEGDGVLLSIGRRAETEGLLAESVQLCMTKGRIDVDEKFCTSMEGVYAIGDVTGGIQLAHAAEAQGIACVEYMSGMETPSVDPSLVPSCVYTTPEIACVGITEEQAATSGRAVKIGKYVMNGNAKTVIEQMPRSFIKLVFDASTEKLLGAQMMCGRASDMIAEMTTAISAGLTKKDVLRALRPHPSFCEAVTDAIELADGHSINTMGHVKK
jgi:dihydrolipoamide dehydrogenase